MYLRRSLMMRVDQQYLCKRTKCFFEISEINEQTLKETTLMVYAFYFFNGYNSKD